MRLVWLFLRSRKAGHAVVALITVCVSAWLWGRVPGIEEGTLMIALLLFPLFAGALVGVVTTSPFGEVEQAVSRTLVDLRAMQAMALLAIPITGLLVASWNWQIEGASEIALRNLSGFAGLSLIAAALIGGRLSWFGPLAYGAASFVIIGDGNSYDWALPSQPAGSAVAAAIAVSVLLGGLILISIRGGRETALDDL